MKIIGITGGVGSGKTQLLAYIREHYNCGTVLADEAAARLQEPGGSCYSQIVGLLGKEILRTDGTIDRQLMAGKIFVDRHLLEQVNAVVHPAVRDFVKGRIQENRVEKKDFFFLEAALLIEAGYEEIVDEFWYIYTDVEERRRRLIKSRGYTQERIDSIIKEQLAEEDFRKACQVVIDNSGTLESSYRQIDQKLGEYLWKN